MNKSLSLTKSLAVVTALLGSMALYSTAVLAETIQGKLNGLECAARGEECPTDRLDPHIAVERDFVVQTADGKYYFITNLDRAIKARYALKMVRVEGTMSPKFNAINADEFWVQSGGDYNMVWSAEMQSQEQRLFGPPKEINR